MKKVRASAEHPGLVVVLDADALPRMQSSETPFQFFENVFVRRDQLAIAPPDRVTAAVPRDLAGRFFRKLKIHLPLRRTGACEAAG